MTTRRVLGTSPLLAVLAGSGLVCLAMPVTAYSRPMKDKEEGARFDAIEARLQAYERRLAAQEEKLSEQAATLLEQKTELASLRAERDRLRDRVLAYTDGGTPDRGPAQGLPAQTPQLSLPAPPPLVLAMGGAESHEALSNVRAGRGYAVADPAASDAPQVAPATDGIPGQPVGEAPPPDRRVQEVSALPERIGVLTPKGHFALTPSFEYVRSSSNRLVFRGVEIVPGIQLGVIEANDADRDSLVGAVAVRYGLTRRLEVEGRLPYVYRHDRVTTVAQRDEAISRTLELEGQEFGDFELSARYQLTEVQPGRAIFVANARLKPPSGRGPYDVEYDTFGVATDLATGSGFWAAEGGVTMLYPTDPAVIFASLSYLHNFGRDINKIIGTAPIGRVDPGDSIGASLGFGLSLNPRFSVSFGYSHNYIFPTKSQIGSAWQKSNSLQVGSILMGWSFRLTEKLTVSNNFQFGVTSDAPGMQATFSLPVKF